jgi:hypothetical protein
MNLDQDERRGEEAHRVLTSDIYKEAFRVIDERLIAQLAVIEITPDRAEYLRQLLVANRKVRAYLEQVMVTGKLAIEQKGLMERMKDRVRQLRY